jgi:large subunit ribosomal protein L15
MAIGLNNLRPAEGSTHKKKRVGRGPGSGLGKTAGRGNKGQKSRSGYSGKVGFEGGQMPLQRRLPKRGFTNIFKKQWIEVTLATLENSFEAGDAITPETMHERGVIAKGKRDIVVLGTGELTKALTVSAHRFTKGARAKIEGAGGTANVISARHKPDALVPVTE